MNRKGPESQALGSVVYVYGPDPHQRKRTLAILPESKTISHNGKLFPFHVQFSRPTDTSISILHTQVTLQYSLFLHLDYTSIIFRFLHRGYTLYQLSIHVYIWFRAGKYAGKKQIVVRDTVISERFNAVLCTNPVYFYLHCVSQAVSQ